MRCDYVKIECIISQRASPRRENGLRTPAIHAAISPSPKGNPCARLALGLAATARPSAPARAAAARRGSRGVPLSPLPGRGRGGAVATRVTPVGRLVQRYTLEVYTVRFTSGLLLCSRLLSPFERPRERRDRVTASQRSRALHKAGVTAVKPAKAGVCGTWRSPLFVCGMFSSALSGAFYRVSYVPESSKFFRIYK